MITKLLDLSGYFVKELNIKNKKVYITVESESLLVCPQ
jgi:hypothetical protein